MIDPDNLPPAAEVKTLNQARAVSGLPRTPGPIAEPLHKVLPTGEPLQRAPLKPCEACPSATACERWGYCNAEAARGEA